MVIAYPLGPLSIEEDVLESSKNEIAAKYNAPKGIVDPTTYFDWFAQKDDKGSDFFSHNSSPRRFRETHISRF